MRNLCHELRGAQIRNFQFCIVLIIVMFVGKHNVLDDYVNVNFG